MFTIDNILKRNKKNVNFISALQFKFDTLLLLLEHDIDRFLVPFIMFIVLLRHGKEIKDTLLLSNKIFFFV